MKNFFSFLIIISFLTACQSTKDALTLKKKESADEFLVEKKSPLVLPPDYGKLPLPSTIDNEQNKNQKNEIEISLGSGLKVNETIKNSEPSSIEKSVLEKIN
tara:strand:- start:288 stop:593 length:306 start_codon:yes stop_codon:yes gene_type:complete